ncbi:hypothetical protein KJ975_01845 [Myxococcota bacterium]|nr:hypothetical protein [Myxococcota bacterium]
MKVVHLSFAVAIAALASGCVDVPTLHMEDPAPLPNPCQGDECTLEVSPSTTRDLDLVFLIDTSLSMADEQVTLQRNFPTLIGVLREISGGLPNLHLGTITPDLGTEPFNIPGCDRPGGDGGRFLKGVNNACANPVGQTYVVDVEPRGCTVEKTILTGQPTNCPSHDCTQANCDVAAFTGLDGTATEPAGLVFATDENGCPRCRNYTDQSLEEVFSCMASVGTGGCGMEQPLEAVKRALDTRTGANAGFWRDNAFLAIFILSDEDDCSAKNIELFYPTGDINSTLGTLTSFRCTEFGVVCDEPWQRVMPQGQLTYTHCRPRESNDPKNMLQPITRYTSMLSQLKDASQILVGAIAGPYEDPLVVGLYDDLNPRLLPACGSDGPDDGQGAVPAVRLWAFVESMLQRDEDRAWAQTSLCAEDFSNALAGLGTRIRGLLETHCLTTPLCGCPDPAFANGEAKLTNLPDAEAAVCEPLCSVQDINGDGHVTELPLCSPDYLDGHPPLRDPALPVPACFHVTFNAACAVPCPDFSTYQGCDTATNPWYGPSRGAELLLSRREDPTPGTRQKIACAGTPLTEIWLCFNGLDDDIDGLVDADDPDCR